MVSHTIVLPRGPGVPLTYAGVRAIEQLLAGMEAEFTVSFFASIRCALHILAYFKPLVHVLGRFSSMGAAWASEGLA